MRKIRSYEYYNPAVIAANARLINRSFESGGKIHLPQDVYNAPHHVRAALWTLFHASEVDKNSGLSFDPTGQTILDTHTRQLIEESVSMYPNIVKILDKELFGEGDGDPAELHELHNQTAQNPHLKSAMVVGAVCRMLEYPKCLDGLKKGMEIDISKLTFAHEKFAEFENWISILRRAGLITREGFVIHATPAGKAVFANPGYSALLASYYPMYAALPELHTGELEYGFDPEDSNPRIVGRHKRLNALGSGGIFSHRIGPHIRELVSHRGVLHNHFGKDMALIDFACGNAELLRQVLADDQSAVQHGFGVDHSAPAIDEAEKNCPDGNFSVGSITDKQVLHTLASNIRETGLQPVGSINFIFHDFGPYTTQPFLQKYGDVFENAPLIATETMRIGDEEIRKHPNYQPLTFQNMHAHSYQTLMDEPSWMAVFRDAGFDVMQIDTHRLAHTHSSVPGLTLKERQPTIRTWVLTCT